MKKATLYCSILLFVLVINTISVMNMPQLSNYSIIKVNPFSADNITNANVTIDRSIIKRGIESVTITFNNSAGLGWPFYKAKIDLPDESHVNITLTNSSETPSIYTGVFTPSITNMTGEANITVLAVDLNGIIQNEGILIRDYEIQIKNNLPYVGVRMNSTEVYRGDTVMFNFTPSDVEQSVYELSWRAALYRKGNPNILVTTFVNQIPTFGYLYTVPLSAVIGDYYINATCWDDDTSHSELYDLSIINNDPMIDGYGFVINDEVVIPTASAIEILRGTRFLLKINATDREGLMSTVLLTITANDPLSGDPLFFPADYANKPMTNLGSNYTLNVTFPLTTNTGIVNLNIRLFENGTNIDVNRTQKFMIKNNPPVLSNFSLNGFTEDQIVVSEGDWLIFGFTVSDAENSIDYMRVYIINNENQNSWNYSVIYQGSSTVVKVRALELGKGTFTAYGYVVDSEGDQDYFYPFYFDIVPIQTFTPTLWLMFAVGIVLGGIASFIISSILFKRIAPIGETNISQERKKVREQKSKKLESEDEEIETEEEAEKEPEEAQPPFKEEEEGEKKKKFVRKL